MLKILQINKMYFPVNGGIERVVQQIAEGLNDRTDIKVLVCQKKGGSCVEKINGVEVHKAASIGTFFSMPISFSFFYEFKNLTKDCDIIHIHMPFPLADIALWLFGFKGKIFVWWHSDIIRQKFFMPFYKPFMKRLLEKCDKIFVATSGHIESSSYLHKYRNKCVIIPYGVDERLFNEKQNSSESKKNSCTKLISFLFVGRLVGYKGCEILLEAFSKVKNAKLTIVGSGPLAKSLKKMAEDLGVADKVYFLSDIDENSLANEFSNCDVFVLPSISKNEAFGIVQIEAMLYGKPVINTNLPGGVPLVSIDGVTGLTVPPNDVVALACAMNKLAEDDELRRSLGSMAYLRAKEKYSLANMLTTLYEEYERTI